MEKLRKFIELNNPISADDRFIVTGETLLELKADLDKFESTPSGSLSGEVEKLEGLTIHEWRAEYFRRHKDVQDLMDTLANLPPSQHALCKKGLRKAVELLEPFDDEGLSLGLGKNALDPIKQALESLSEGAPQREAAAPRDETAIARKYYAEMHAAFSRIMGDPTMPEDSTPEYDEWLFEKAFDAGAQTAQNMEDADASARKDAEQDFRALGITEVKLAHPTPSQLNENVQRLVEAAEMVLPVIAFEDSVAQRCLREALTPFVGKEK